MGIIVTLICAKVFIAAPSYYARQSLSAGWADVLLSGIFEALILFLVLKLSEGFEGMDLVDIAEASFGTFGRILTGAVSCFVFLAFAAAYFRCFAEMIGSTIIKEISFDYVSVFVLAAVAVGAYLGIRTQINLNCLIIPFLAAAVLIMLLVISPQYTVNNISPLMGAGGETFSNALLHNASYTELGAILFLIPYLKEKHTVKRVGFTAIFISCALLSLITLCYQLAVPYEAAGSFTLPVYQMTRMLEAGSFMKRLEPLIVFVWSGALFIYIGCTIRFASNSFKKAFSLSAAEPTVFAFAAIVFLAASVPGEKVNITSVTGFLLKYGCAVYPILPLALLALARLFKGRKGGAG